MYSRPEICNTGGGCIIATLAQPVSIKAKNINGIFANNQGTGPCRRLDVQTLNKSNFIHYSTTIINCAAGKTLCVRQPSLEPILLLTSQG